MTKTEARALLSGNVTVLEFGYHEGSMVSTKAAAYRALAVRGSRITPFVGSFVIVPFPGKLGDLTRFVVKTAEVLS